MPTATTNLANLDNEIGNLRGGLESRLRTRKRHPTYGVTKADLREALAWLEGALLARAALQGESMASPLLAIRRQANNLDMNLTELRLQVDAA